MRLTVEIQSYFNKTIQNHFFKKIVEKKSLIVTKGPTYKKWSLSFHKWNNPQKTVKMNKSTSKQALGQLKKWFLKEFIYQTLDFRKGW